MPRFPVTFRRKSTAAEDPNGPVAEHSFRVLERSEVTNGKSFDGGARLARMTAPAPKPNVHSDLVAEDNIFAGLKNNRGSGSSNTTKTASDNSSRHSNASTAPSSTDFPQQEDWRHSNGRKHSSMAEGPAPPPHKNGGFLKQAGRTFSFGGNKKTSLPTIPAEEPVPTVPSMPDEYGPGTPRGGRSRAETASTTSTATPPKVEDTDFMLDLGGDLSSMLKFDKRASVATLKGLMSNRVPQPSPLNIDNTAPIEPPQHSWNSQHSADGLLSTGRTLTSPPAASESRPPPVPRHHSTPLQRRRSDEDDEDTTLLRDSIAATQYLSNETSGPSGGSTRYRRDEEDEVAELRSSPAHSYSRTSRFSSIDDDNMFDRPLSRPRVVPRQNGRTNSQPQNKVMTPAEFEKYSQDKAREEIMGLNDDPESDKEDEDNYDDDEDEREKTKQLAKQRKKQEAHMTVYRQQMMKVTGESGNSNATTNANTSGHASRPSIAMSISAPNLVLNDGPVKGVSPSPPSDGSESDEEVPLAILAAHGFPNKNRPPTRLTTMSSNPNLRASVQQPSYVAGPGSVMGDANGGHLPPFARKLPQDPYLGAGLINQPPRESFALGGGAAASPAVPTGGLVGVIANEERSRALRRGSPALDNTRNIQANGMRMNGGFDPISGIPPQMMYPMGMPQMPQMPNQMMTPSDQMQMQMSQQMQQFMQMQMQFMQMMADRGQGQGQDQMQGSLRPQGHMPTHSMSSLGDIPRNSFMGDMMGNRASNGMSLDLPRGDNQMRTMSMVQPSSAPWLQPPQTGYAPSIRAQGQGYAPSIAPSERSNIGLPGRYRPVSSVAMGDHGRTSSMSGALPTLHSKLQAEVKVSPMNNKEEDDDDEQGWEAMKAKREKKKSIWRTKKTFGEDIGALIN